MRLILMHYFFNVTEVVDLYVTLLCAQRLKCSGFYYAYLRLLLRVKYRKCRKKTKVLLWIFAIWVGVGVRDWGVTISITAWQLPVWQLHGMGIKVSLGRPQLGFHRGLTLVLSCYSVVGLICCLNIETYLAFWWCCKLCFVFLRWQLSFSLLLGAAVVG